MNMDDLIALLRKTSNDYENKQIALPIEIVNVINGNEEEKSWEKISVGKVMYYLADMLEE